MRSFLFPAALASLVLAAVACGEEKNDGGPDGPLHAWAEEAQAEFPDVLSLHTKVIARTCAPNGGVCHNTKEYPDLHTPGNFVMAVSRPCNLDLAEEPENIFDGCEPEADVLEAGSFRSRVAWLGDEIYDESTGYYGMPIRLEDAAPRDFEADDVVFKRKGSVLVDAEGILYLDAGSKEGWLLNLYELDHYEEYLVLLTVTGGDPNGNGVFGGEDGWAEIKPGRLDKSYLWARITGTVPGTRMPLANQALSNPEYVAIACWIETVGSQASVTERIEYEDCRYARAPTDYEWVPE